MKTLILFALMLSVCVSAKIVYDDPDYEELYYFCLPTLLDTETGKTFGLGGEKSDNKLDVLWTTNFFGTTINSYDGVPGNYLYDSSQIILNYYQIGYGTKTFTDFVEFYTSLLVSIQNSEEIGSSEFVGDLLLDNDSDGLVNFVDSDYISIPEPFSILFLAGGIIFIKRNWRK